MITEEYFLQKITEIARMKCVPIPREHAKGVFKRFQEFENSDLEAATDNVIFSDDRFDFVKLLKFMNHHQADQLEYESRQNLIKEGEAAERFFNESRYTGECKRLQCRGCQYIHNCEVRGKEWVRGINSIMRGRLGKAGAEELINYMNREFMGGIK